MPALRTSPFLIAAALTATLTVAACTAGTPTAVTTITTAVPAASGQASAAQSSSAAPTSRASITSTPGDAATGASVLDPVVVRAADGTLDAVVVTNPEGREVAGELSADGTTWTSAEPLGYARTYTIEAVARDAGGLTTASSSSFRTVAPAGVISPRSSHHRTGAQLVLGNPSR